MNPPTNLFILLILLILKILLRLANNKKVNLYPSLYVTINMLPLKELIMLSFPNYKKIIGAPFLEPNISSESPY